MCSHLHILKSPKVLETAVMGRQTVRSTPGDRSVCGSHAVSSSKYLSTFRRGILPKELILYKSKPSKFNNYFVGFFVGQRCSRVV
jgi:hypothetical protein